MLQPDILNFTFFTQSLFQEKIIYSKKCVNFGKKALKRIKRLSFYPKKKAEMQQKIHLQQNTVCWKQQIYPSPENFTPALLVALVTFGMSGCSCSTNSRFSTLRLENYWALQNKDKKDKNQTILYVYLEQCSVKTNQICQLFCNLGWLQFPDSAARRQLLHPCKLEAGLLATDQGLRLLHIAAICCSFGLFRAAE